MVTEKKSTVESYAWQQGQTYSAGQRLSLKDIMERYFSVIAEIPGQDIEVRATDLGVERRCLYRIEVDAPAGQASGSQIQLVFSLLDFDKRRRPIAVLVFEDTATDQPDVMLALDSLDDTHEQLNELLKSKGAPVAAFVLASAYIESLRKVKELVVRDIKWA